MRIFLVVLVFIFSNGLAAQDNANYSEVSESRYLELKEDLGFDKTKKRLKLKKKYIPKFEEEEEEAPSVGAFGEALLQALAYLAILGLLGFIVYMVFSNVRVDKKVELTDEVYEEIENIDEVDAEAKYKAALAAGDHRLAVRMLFIMVLQKLSKEGKIDWEKEKTNRDYHRELEDSQIRQHFRTLSTIYERVWYGDAKLDVQSFRQYDQRFLDFIKNQI